jgi:hypothetical protein
MIKDLKELERFLKICRKQGVTDISFDGVSVKLGELPQKSSDDEATDDIATPDMLTDDQLAFYHLTGANQ